VPIGASGVPTNKQLQDAERALKKFDWSKADAFSDEEIRRAAAADPDSAAPTDEELAEFRLVTPADKPKPRDAAE
jgi:hypothetical protein